MGAALGAAVACSPDPMRAAPLTLIDAGAGPDATSRLAARLDLQIAEPPGDPAGSYLATANGLGFRCPRESGDGTLTVVSDLLAAGDRRGAVRVGGGLPLLARAVGLDRDVRTVVDATAGLGRDAATLVALGATVTLIERDPVLADLLEDALLRAQAAAPEFAARANLRRGDALALLAELTPAPDVILLDPMFPERGKRALPKQDLQLFRAWLGPGDAGEIVELLELARSCARRRVVVKRPPRVKPVAPGAVACLEGPRVRFDVYAPATPTTRNANPT